MASALLVSWSFDPGVVAPLLLATALYVRGFRELRLQLPARFPPWRRNAFLAGVGALLLALASPLDALADLLLQAHMVQHWLLMMVAPPLLWLGAPAVPLLRGLPRRWLRRGLGPFLGWPWLRRTLHAATHPVCAWLAWALTTLVWHWPVAYQAAVRSRGWHDLEHASFLAASLLFWYPVLAPWPARRAVPRAGAVLYLGLAAAFNTVFSAAFAFSTRVFYPVYADAPRPFGLDALADQNAAGAFLWGAASLPMLVGAVVLLMSLLEPVGPRPPPRPEPRGRTRRTAPRGRRRHPVARRLRSQTLRRSLQGSLLVLAAAIVADGWLGPERPSALNLAGVLPWTYWRGLVVIGLLVLGNVFCAVCPFTLPRSLAGRWLRHPLSWPAALRSRWLPAVLFAGYLFAYEAFALWDSPWWTAWIVVGYFAACFLVDALFPRGTFCRHVCPIGQFQFVSTGISPLEVARLDAATCGRCTSHDCLRGGTGGPGCPTGLFLPTKAGSLDCTFCLDCVRACPHDNAGLRSVAPGASLGRGRAARGEGGGGLDLAALTLLFGFGAFANAAAMVAPVAAWERAVATSLGLASTLPVLSAWLGLALVGAPALLALACAAGSRTLARLDLPLPRLIARLSPALVPLGFSMWLAHFGFHLATGLGTALPAVARAARDLAPAATGARAAHGLAPGFAPETLVGLEITVLGVGLVVGVAVLWRLALELASGDVRRALGGAAPWLLRHLALDGLGVWIVLQPMEMRGMPM